MRLGRKRDVQACFLTQLLTIIHRVIVTYTDYRLLWLISGISLNHVILPLLIHETAVVIRENHVELLIRNLQLTHPESFVNLHFRRRTSIGLPTIATHHELSGRNANKCHLDTRSQLNLLTGFLLVGQHSLDPVRIEWPTFHLQLFFLDRSQFLRHLRFDLTFTLQVSGIIGDLFLPIHACAIRILIRQLFTTLDLVKALIRDDILRKHIRIEITLIRSVVINPVIKGFPLFIRQLHVKVPFLQHTNQFTRVRMIFIRLKNHHITLATLTVYIRMQIQVRSAIT